jgi:hypothetical protein
MNVTLAEDKPDVEAGSVKVAILAIIFSGLSWGAISFESYFIDTHVFGRTYPPSLDRYLLAQHFLLLCPMLVIFLNRRTAQIAAPYALGFFVILVGRSYYLLKMCLLDEAVPKFDWAALLQFIAGGISAVLLAGWAVIRLAIVARPPRNRTLPET